ncbi:hypothetical protein NIES4071_89290 [Calothrix sp. NIES-4071]|nr:hypothetical protein NIES4071_89290 [Calothrix sp. NIES-4071]BAZ63196.1 hypothetical protein NIES4105_89220 [Calothrix sp. NIES-4105]
MGRKKLERTTMLARVASSTPEKVKEIAAKLGYIYGEEGSAGQLLDAVASGELILVQRSKNIETCR